METSGEKQQDVVDAKDYSLRVHNELRNRHHDTPPLTWSDEIAKGAQEWADKLVKLGKLQHGSHDYGENIYSQWSSVSLDVNDVCEKAVHKWYNEIESYDFSKPGFKNGVGHFSQVVWKDSTELGVGVANASKKGGYEVVVVARYSKAGNMLNRFEENVRPVKAGSTSSCITDKIESIEIKDKDASTKINSGKSSEIKDVSLRIHNEMRNRHVDTTALLWCDDLAMDAQEWADKLAKTGKLQHGEHKFGENLYSQWSSGSLNEKDVCKNAVQAWYNEIKSYDFNKPGFKSGIGHFTQVVWKDSQKVGVGIAYSNKNNGHEAIVVARYSPAGNMLNRFPKNVMSVKAGSN